jgi:PAS domain S-box-containing protein
MRDGQVDPLQVNADLEQTRLELELQTQALLEVRSESQAILDLVVDGILLVDRDVEVESCNATALALFGYPAEEVLGSPVDRLLPGIGSFISRPAGPSRFEIAGRRRDGQVFPAEVSVRGVRGSGRRRVLLVRDCTERMAQDHALKESLQQFQQIADQIADAFYVATLPAGRCLYVSPAFESMFGRPFPSETQAGPPWLAWVCEQDRERLAEVHRQVQQGQPSGEVQYRILWPDGQVRSLRERLYGPREGDRDRMSGIIQDVTQSERLAQELRQAQRLEAVGTLASGIAHDFNNLLMGVSGAVELALDELPESSTAHRALKRALESTRRGSALTRQLLAFGGKRRAGTIVSTVSLDRAVQDVAPTLARLVGEHISLRTELGTDGLHVPGEVGDLEQLLFNLATNARDAMPKGGELRLSTRRGEGTGDAPELHLSIEDTGLGMDATTLEHIFDPFFTTKPVGQGTGLGLSNVQAVVQRLGGRIEVQSQPAKGTVFTVSLPLVSPAPSLDLKAQRQLPWGGQTVLLVEDDLLVREMVRRQLQALGYHVLEAGTPAQAVAWCRDRGQPIDVLLTDVMMPGQLGTDLANELRVILPSLRVLLMSAHPQEEHARAGRSVDGAGFIGKPFDTAALGRVLADLLRPRRTSGGVPLLRHPRGRRRASDPAEVDPADLITAASPPVRRARVLVVDDEPDLAALLSEALSLRGHEVATARTGPEAMERARQLRPHVVLCDLNLGEPMNGYEIARALRREASIGDADLVALTGMDARSCIERAREAGFDRVLSKPVTLAQLEAVLAERLAS